MILHQKISSPYINNAPVGPKTMQRLYLHRFVAGEVSDPFAAPLIATRIFTIFFGLQDSKFKLKTFHCCCGETKLITFDLMIIWCRNRVVERLFFKLEIMCKFGNWNQERIADVFDGDSLPSIHAIDNWNEMSATHLPQIIEIYDIEKTRKS